ncbi:MAG: class II aldolase/adducin family protein [Chloroflexi bacterium]|nr:class II aldolase/adducin family protein [Chloroflexota bacterium]
MSIWDAERRSVLQTAQQLLRKGLVSGSSGNVSMRLRPPDGADLLAVTPSRRRYEELQPQDIAVIDFEGEPVEGELIPSIESMMHVAIYRVRPDVGAVIHNHSVYASVLAVARLDLPPIIDELVTYVGGEVKVADYGFPGSEELAENACAGLGERNAVLLANHGVIAVGADLAEALSVSELVERAAMIYVYASLLGKVSLLPSDVVEAEKGFFRMLHGAK